MAVPVDFPEGALPYCVFTHEDDRRRLGVGIGDELIDLSAAAGSLEEAVDPALLVSPSLNPLLAAGRPVWTALRESLLDAVAAGDLDGHRIPQREVELHLAWEVADFVDFYSSLHHASNVGRMFRPDAEPLLPNWRYLPVAYHGRAGTVYVDGTSVHRPRGQRRGGDGEVEFGPSIRLDIEAELGWVLGGATAPGQSVRAEDAAEHLFGLVLLNDWSARDIQAWEYVPLGPFLGKSFATSVSAWVVPLAALDDARTEGPSQDPVPLPYLRVDGAWAFDVEIEVWLRPAGSDETTRVAQVNAAEGLYWNAAQQLAHMTVNGATVRPGDLFGTGTISGPGRHQRGSLLELTWNGSEPIAVGGHTRTFLENGDEVTFRASFPFGGGRAPLGPVTGAVLASRPAGTEL